MSKFIAKIKSFFARLFGSKPKTSTPTTPGAGTVHIGVNPPKQPR